MQGTTNDEVLVNPPAMTNDEVRASLLQMAQSITTQDHVFTGEANSEVVPQEKPHAFIIASRFRHFTRMHPLILFRSKFYEDPQRFPL